MVECLCTGGTAVTHIPCPNCEAFSVFCHPLDEGKSIQCPNCGHEFRMALSEDARMRHKRKEQERCTKREKQNRKSESRNNWETLLSKLGSRISHVVHSGGAVLRGVVLPLVLLRTTLLRLKVWFTIEATCATCGNRVVFRVPCDPHNPASAHEKFSALLISPEETSVEGRALRIVRTKCHHCRKVCYWSRCPSCHGKTGFPYHIVPYARGQTASGGHATVGGRSGWKECEKCKGRGNLAVASFDTVPAPTRGWPK